MDMKERLENLIANGRREAYKQCPSDSCWYCAESCGVRDAAMSDYLLSKGVIVPPVKVGDKVYQYDNGGRIYESKVVWFYYDKDYRRVVYDCNSGLAFSEDAIGKTVFLTREEAEKALEGMK